MTALVMLILVTLLTFANSSPDALVFDDKAFVGPEPLVQLDSFSHAFTEDLWHNRSGLYRPLLLVSFEFQNRLFGSWLRGYHLVNIFLHLAATLLLFGFLRYLLISSGQNIRRVDLVALLPSLIFAVHPAHTEVVNSVFNSSSIFVSIFAISGLWWLLSRLETKPFQAWAGLGLCYTLAILFKESALVIPGIAVAFVILLTEGDIKQRIRRMLPVFWLLIPIAIFFWARAVALAPDQAGVTPGSAIPQEFEAVFNSIVVSSEHSWLGKLALYGNGLEVLIWPYPLQLYYARPDGLAAAFLIAIQFIFAIWAFYLFLKGKPGMLAGLAFYYIALSPSARMISLDGAYPHLNERYLYFPSIGLTICLAFGVRYLFKKFGSKRVTIFTLPVLVLLAALSWERNSEWASEVNLFETEYQQGHRGHSALRLLISSHNSAERYQRVAQICEENTELYVDIIRLVNTCAVAFSRLGRTDDAIKAFEIYAQHGETWIVARLSLASIYVAQGRRQKAADQFVDIINRVEEPERKEIYKGDLLVALYRDDHERLLQAKRHFQTALAIKPGWEPATERLEALDKLLADMEEATGQETPQVDPQTGPE